MDKRTPPGPVGLKSETRETPGWREISFKGEIDLATRPVMQEALDRCFETRPARLLINLSETDFLGAVGILLLFQARRRCQTHSIEFKIRLSPPAERTLRLCCRVPGDIGALCRLLLSHQIDGPLSSHASSRVGHSLVSSSLATSPAAVEGLADRFVVDWALPLTQNRQFTSGK